MKKAFISNLELIESCGYDIGLIPRLLKQKGFKCSGGPICPKPDGIIESVRDIEGYG